jgi:Zn-dependent protease with chaperone function
MRRAEEHRRLVRAKVFLIICLFSTVGFLVLSWYLFSILAEVALAVLLLLLWRGWRAEFSEPYQSLATQFALLPDDRATVDDWFLAPALDALCRSVASTTVVLKLMNLSMVGGQTHVNFAILRSAEAPIVQLYQGAIDAGQETSSSVLIHELGHLNHIRLLFLTKVSYSFATAFYALARAVGLFALLLLGIIVLLVLLALAYLEFILHILAIGDPAIAVFAVTVAAYVMCLLLAVLSPFAASRQLEYAADAVAASVVGPQAMVKTLRKMAESARVVPSQESSKQLLSQMTWYQRWSARSSVLIEPSDLGLENRVKMLLSTHPASIERMHNLETRQARSAFKYAESMKRRYGTVVGRKVEARRPNAGTRAT